MTVIPFFPYSRRRIQGDEVTGGLDPNEDGIADALAGYGLHARDVGMPRAAFEWVMAARRRDHPFAFPFALLGRPGVGWRAAARHQCETNSYDLLGQPTRRRG